MTITAYSITVSNTTASAGVSVSYSRIDVKKLIPIRILAGVSFIPKYGAMYTKQDTLTKINKKYSRSYIENEKSIMKSSRHLCTYWLKLDQSCTVYSTIVFIIQLPSRISARKIAMILGTNVNVCS